MNYNDLDNAIEMALEFHGQTLDKGGKLYILHPLHVMIQMDTIEEMIVAVLHDLLEDTEATPEDIDDMVFSKSNDGIGSLEVAHALDAITKEPHESKEHYWARVKANPLALRVKLKDIEHNSSEERLKCLPVNEANYLREKYKKALEFLTKKD